MKTKTFSAVYGVWMAVFTVIPLLFVAYYAFFGETGSFSLNAFSDSIGALLPNMLLSLKLALYSTVICLLVGYPMAYIISRASQRAQNILIILIMLPMWMNFILRIYGLMNMLETNGLVNNLLVSLGFERLTLIHTEGAVVFGMVYEFLPFMVLPLYTVMSKIDPALLEAANDLGCGSLGTLFKVIIPLSVPGIVSGITMVFVPAASTFVISQKLGNTDTFLIGDAIENFFMYNSNYAQGSALSLVLMVAILICMGVMNRFSDDDDGAILI